MNKCEICENAVVGQSYMIQSYAPCAKCREYMGIQGKHVPALYMGLGTDDEGQVVHTFRFHKFEKCHNCGMRGHYGAIPCDNHNGHSTDNEEVYRQLFGIPVERYAR